MYFLTSPSFLLCAYLSLAPIIQGDSIISKHHPITQFFVKLLTLFGNIYYLPILNSITNYAFLQLINANNF